MGETCVMGKDESGQATFSILERIDVGETSRVTPIPALSFRLSVSSNGSTWVKQFHPVLNARGLRAFSILERIDVGET